MSLNMKNMGFVGLASEKGTTLRDFSFASSSGSLERENSGLSFIWLAKKQFYIKKIIKNGITSVHTKLPK